MNSIFQYVKNEVDYIYLNFLSVGRIKSRLGDGEKLQKFVRDLSKNRKVMGSPSLCLKAIQLIPPDQANSKTYDVFKRAIHNEELVKNSTKRTQMEILRFEIETGDPHAASLMSSLQLAPNQRLSNGSTLLHQAVLSGKRRLVKQMIKRGGEVNSTDSQGNTPLNLLCQQRTNNQKEASEKLSMIKVLLGAEAKVDKRNNSKLTPLAYASQQNETEIARLLIDNKADPNKRLRRGQTALTIACKYLSRGVVDLLLEKGADVDVTTKDGETPLTAACSVSGEKIALKLINQGAEFDVRTRSSDTPLSLASANGLSEVVRRAPEALDPNRKNSEGLNAFGLAMTRGNWDTAQALLERFPQIDVDKRISKKGPAPLEMLGRASNQRTLARTILKRSAHPEKGVQDYLSMLLPVKVVSDEDQDMLEWLFEKKELSTDLITPRTPSEQQSNLLVQACAIGNSDLAWLLIDLGADPIPYDVNGMSPLEAAVTGGWKDASLVLLEKEAVRTQINGVSNLNTTVLGQAVKMGHFTLADLLVEEGANPFLVDGEGNTPFLMACSRGEVEWALKQIALVEDPDQLNYRNSAGLTALHMAAMGGHANLIAVLLEREANPELKDHKGCTPLALACARGNLEAVKALVLGEELVGEDLNNEEYQLTSGATLLHVAAANDRLEVVRFLLESGANPIANPNSGETVLQSACKRDNVNVAMELLAASDTPAGREAVIQAAMRSESSEALVKLVEMGVRTDYIHEGNNLLMACCATGNLAAVQAVAGEAPDLTIRNDLGQTALHIALEDGHYELARWLIEKGADPDIADNEQTTSLHLACSTGNSELAKAAIDKSTQRDAVNKKGESALHLASRKGDRQTAVHLLMEGAKRDLRNDSGETPLMVAVQARKIETIGFLAPASKDFDPELFKHYCAEGFSRSAATMVKGAPELMNPLSNVETAVKYRCWDVFSAVVDKLPEEALQSDVGLRLLTMACNSGLEGLGPKIISHQNLKEMRTKAEVLLISACKHNMRETAEALLDQMEGPIPYEVLSLACRLKWPKLASRVLDKGVSAEKGKDSTRALDLITKECDASLGQVALRLLASFPPKESDIPIIFRLACEKGLDTVAFSILKNNRYRKRVDAPGDYLLSACRGGSKALATQMMAECGQDLRYADPEVLMWALHQGWGDLACTFMEAGLKIDPSWPDLPPLGINVEQNGEGVLVQLQKGVPLVFDKETAGQLLELARPADHSEAFIALLEQGAKPSVACGERWIQHAKTSRSPALLCVLIHKEVMTDLEGVDLADLKSFARDQHRSDWLSALTLPGDTLPVEITERSELLLAACKYGRAELALGLIKRSHLDVRDAEGHTPFFLACRSGLKEVAEKLMKEGVDPAGGSPGNSPLIEAQRQGWDELFDALKGKGARLDLQDMDALCARGEPEIVEQIMGLNEKGGKSRMRALHKKALDSSLASLALFTAPGLQEGEDRMSERRYLLLLQNTARQRNSSLDRNMLNLLSSGAGYSPLKVGEQMRANRSLAEAVRKWCRTGSAPLQAEQMSAAYPDLFDETDTVRAITNIFLNRSPKKDVVIKKGVYGWRLSRSAPIMASCYRALLQKKSRLEPSTRESLERLSSSLEDVGFLSEDSRNNPDAFSRGCIKKVMGLKPGEWMQVPVESEGHGMLLQVTRTKNNTLTVRLFNTGQGLVAFHASLPGTERYQPFVEMEEVPIRTLTKDDFWKWLAVEGPKGDPYPIYERLLTLSPRREFARGRPEPEHYRRPQAAGTCSVQCMEAASRYIILTSAPTLKEGVAQHKAVKSASRQIMAEFLLKRKGADPEIIQLAREKVLKSQSTNKLFLQASNSDTYERVLAIFMDQLPSSRASALPYPEPTNASERFHNLRALRKEIVTQIRKAPHLYPRLKQMLQHHPELDVIYTHLMYSAS